MSKEEKKEKIVTVRDFKSMVEGMDTVMGDDWVPDQQQWKRIREKIRMLENAPPPPAPAPVQQRPVEVPQGSEESILANFPQVPSSIPAGDINSALPPAGPSAFSPENMPRPQAPMITGDAAPMVQGAVPGASIPLDQMTPEALQAAAEVAKGEKVKTPDIDSTDGYESGFV